MLSAVSYQLCAARDIAIDIARHVFSMDYLWTAQTLKIMEYIQKCIDFHYADMYNISMRYCWKKGSCIFKTEIELVFSICTDIKGQTLNTQTLPCFYMGTCFRVSTIMLSPFRHREQVTQGPEKDKGPVEGCRAAPTEAEVRGGN